jgi:hypothetical protein
MHQPMLNSDISTILERYLSGEIEVAEAAETLMSSAGSRPGFSIDMRGMDSSQQERVEALMGRLMWLVLRAQDPDAAPAEPIDAAGWRALHEDIERETEARDEESGSRSKDA